MGNALRERSRLMGKTDLERLAETLTVLTLADAKKMSDEDLAELQRTMGNAGIIPPSVGMMDVSVFRRLHLNAKKWNGILHDVARRSGAIGPDEDLPPQPKAKRLPILQFEFGPKPAAPKPRKETGPAITGSALTATEVNAWLATLPAQEL